MKRLLLAVGAALFLGVPAAAALPAAPASACAMNLAPSHGDGYAQLTVNQSCGDPAWIWARFHSSGSYTNYGIHRVAPPGAPKYSVTGSGSQDGWGRPYAGGRCLWYGGARHCVTLWGSGAPPASGAVHAVALAKAVRDSHVSMVTIHLPRGAGSADLTLRLSKRCTTHLHAEWNTATVNGRGPHGQTEFSSGADTCGRDQRASLQHCPGSPCPWAEGSWKAADLEFSKAQAPAGSTMQWLYTEFRSNSTGVCSGHWTWYPVKDTTATGGCP